MLSIENILGLDDSHVCEVESGCYLVPEVADAYRTLQHAAAAEGFDLKAVSAYRSCSRQLRIWNQKACGERAILCEASEPMAIDGMDDVEKMYAILRWSALPGASRHHWGTDFDIFDASALPTGQTLALTVEETLASGPFFPMYQWLEDYLASSTSLFFRPYDYDRGGVSPEPWHLSYRPMASSLMQQLSLTALRELVSSMDIELSTTIATHLDEIYTRFVTNVSEPS